MTSDVLILDKPTDVNRAAKIAAFMHWFGVSGAQASVLFQLFDRRGHFLTTDQLAGIQPATPGALQVRVSRLRDAMRQRISRLRDAMDCEAIDTDKARGYTLTEIGISECMTAMTAFGESLLA